MVYIGSNNNYQSVIEKGVSELGLEADLQTHLLTNCFNNLETLLELKKEWVEPMPTIKLQIA